METVCPNPKCRSSRLFCALECSEPYTLDGSARTFSFRFLTCRDCGLGWVSPQPSPAVLTAFYGNDYAYWSAAQDRLSTLRRLRYWIAAGRYPWAGRGGRWRALIARSIEALSRHDISYSLAIPLALGRAAAILDYGFGAGQFLLDLRRLGYSEVWGYDVVENEASLGLLHEAGVRVLQGRALEQVPAGHFDCIRLEHVLEHLPDPIESLEFLRTRLKPGGVVVLTIPSIHPWEPVESIAGSEFKTYLQLPIHLWQHSARSMEDFLTAAGLVPLGVRRLRPHSYITALARRSGAGEEAAPR